MFYSKYVMFSFLLMIITMHFYVKIVCKFCIPFFLHAFIFGLFRSRKTQKKSSPVSGKAFCFQTDYALLSEPKPLISSFALAMIASQPGFRSLRGS